MARMVGRVPSSFPATHPCGVECYDLQAWEHWDRMSRGGTKAFGSARPAARLGSAVSKVSLPFTAVQSREAADALARKIDAERAARELEEIIAEAAIPDRGIW